MMLHLLMYRLKIGGYCVAASGVFVGCVSAWSIDPRWCYRDESTGMRSLYSRKKVNMTNVAKNLYEESFLSHKAGRRL